MELISFDTTRIIYLTQVHRIAGQPFLPEVAAKLIQRYSFAKYPTMDDLQKDVFGFHLGKFRDVQINELGIYNDGIIVAARCNTKLLDNFIEDLFEWAKEEVGLVTIPQIKSEKHFESALIVQSTVDLAAAVSPNKMQADLISSTLEKQTGIPFYSSGTLFDCDPIEAKMRRKPARFSIERRLGLPFSGNIFYCQAALKSDDHLDLLRALEGLGQS